MDRAELLALLNTLKTELKAELRQEFAAQLPAPPPPVEHFSADPEAPAPTTGQGFAAQWPEPPAPPTPPTPEHFSAAQGRELAQQVNAHRQALDGISTQVQSAFSSLAAKFDALQATLDKIPNPYAGRPEATGGADHSRMF
ncbi:MAG: hypothetical protein R3E95_23970 [Thiolinea sp.]